MFEKTKSCVCKMTVTVSVTVVNIEHYKSEWNTIFNENIEHFRTISCSTKHGTDGCETNEFPMDELNNY